MMLISRSFHIFMQHIKSLHTYVILAHARLC